MSAGDWVSIALSVLTLAGCGYVGFRLARRR